MPKSTPRPVCQFPGCDKPVARSTGRKRKLLKNCSAHRAHRANRRPWNANLYTVDGERFARPNGYVDVVVNGKRVLEHRHVMETMLRRPLVKGESVHHINGKRDDNRPENLELWVMSPRWGIRGKDLYCPCCGANYWHEFQRRDDLSDA